MTPTATIQRAAADGVMLALSPDGSIKASGRKAVLNQWLPVIRERKAELVEALRLVPIPGEIQALIDKVMALRDCPESDREAFADDWRQDPEGIELGLRHLADYYGKGDQCRA